jgi:site-specific DNA recombinase
MSSTNGRGPKRAILYARVSTEEQARSGYSLRQQMERLREHAGTEGYEVLEEVTDPGQSGASLERPGMDRVRDLVAAGGVSVVLAQDRDRFAREPAFHYLLKREFEERDTKIRSLNDRGDESPEGELTDGILDQLAKFERAKMSERTRRGKLEKAKEGKVSAAMKPPYGFRYNDARDALVIYEPEMIVVEKIFRLAAEGFGTKAIQTRLARESIPSPRGKPNWGRDGIKELVLSDLYKPHTYGEIAKLVSASVANALDPEATYGIRWCNRVRHTRRQVSVSDGNGGRSYRTHNTIRLKDREEWIAVPDPSHLPGELVEQARAAMSAQRAVERKYLARDWELRGTVRCGGCGVLMTTHTTYDKGSDKKTYYYYKCRTRHDYKRGHCRQKNIRAEPLEAYVWEFVYGLLKEPERIRAGMERLIDQEHVGVRGDPDKEARVWAEKLEECARLRSAYQE